MAEKHAPSAAMRGTVDTIAGLGSSNIVKLAMLASAAWVPILCLAYIAA